MRWVSTVTVAILSLGLAFFGTVNVLFSDRLTAQDTLSAFVYVLLVYGVLSAAVHALAWRAGWVWVWWITVPAVLLGILFGLSDGALGTAYLWGILVTIVLASVGGRVLVRSFRRTPSGPAGPRPR